MIAKLRAATAATMLATGFVAICAGAPGCASFEAWRLYQTGTEALDGGDTGRAIAELERAVELLPQASEVHNHLGLAYLAAGRDSDAAEAFQVAVDLDCDNSAAAQNLRVVGARVARDRETR